MDPSYWKSIAGIGFALSVFSTSIDISQAQAWNPSPPDDQHDLRKWGCYDPAPGHPSTDEKKRFLAVVRTFAVKAEKDFGVPAPAIAAMTAVESGYGWTRTALFARNFFGWKSSDGDPAAYHLWCQLATDPKDDNEYYVIFPSLEASIANIAKRLRDSSNYKNQTARYQADLSSGEDVNAAILRWVDNIAKPYNQNPPEYRATLRRVMNNPLTPSNKLDPKETLYNIAVSSRPNAITESAAYRSVVRYMSNKLDPGKRYTDDCIDRSGSVHLDFKGYEGYPVTRCIYVEESGLKGIAFTLNPTSGQLARWIANACMKLSNVDQSKCATDLFDSILNSNGAQYAAAGDIIENGADGISGCGDATRSFHIQFRDGIAVSIRGKNFCTPEREITLLEEDAKSSDVNYRWVARTAALNIIDYETLLNIPKGSLRTTEPLDRPKKYPKPEWAQLSRTSFLAAIDTGDYSFLNLVAKSRNSGR